jgi:hypothetical protein
MIRVARLLLVPILFSCHQDTSKTEELRPNNWKRALHGVWAPAGYVRVIKQTKSPFEASKTLDGISELSIDTTGISADSLFVGVGWNNHEGSNFYMRLTRGESNNSLPISQSDYDNPANFYELAYEVTVTDTFLVLYHFDKGKKLLDKSRFSRVTYESASISDGLQGYVNSVLISGKYKLSGDRQTVEFNNAGIVTGLGHFKKYFIQTDFVITMDNDADNIIFDVYSKNQARFAFKIRQDTIDLYRTTSDSLEMEMRIDSLSYRLIRLK